MLLIDEAWAKSNPYAARLAGYGGIIGYLSEDNTGKNLTRADIDAIHAQGLAVGFADEYGATEALGGSSAGRARAIKTQVYASALGAPRGTAFYAPADWDVGPGQMSLVLDYAVAHDAYLRDNFYRGGMYGGYPVCAYLRAHGYTGLLWQTYAWSGGQWLDGVAIRQTRNGIIVGGANVDQDEAEVIDWGQWSPPEGSITMTQLPSDADLSVNAALLTGGPSCGQRVPTEFRAPNDTTGNAIVSKLDYLIALMLDIQRRIQDLSTSSVTLPDAQVQAIGQLNNVLGVVAAHLK